MTSIPQAQDPRQSELATRFAEAVQAPPEARSGVSSFVEQLTDRERRVLTRLLKQQQGLDPDAIIGSLPPSEILDDREIPIYEAERIRDLPDLAAPGHRFSVVMKATRLCNLRCAYCHSWAEGPNQTMGFPVLARIIRETTGMPGVRSISYFWHGGEPTLLKTKFFKKMIWLQQQFKPPGLLVRNHIQTNGTHLSDEWLDFLSALGMGVGVSLDGPPEIHDRRRLTRSGGPSSHHVRAGIQKLRDRKIPFGVLMVVDEALAAVSPQALLRYLVDIGVRSVDFLNVVPENVFEDGKAHGRYLPFSQYVEFLVSVFHTWQLEFRGALNITNFDEFIGALQTGRRPVECLWSGDCADKFVTVEANGDIAPCDRLIGLPNSTMGNVLAQPLVEILHGAAFVRSAREESDKAKAAMKGCKWFDVCRGGCPHDRLLNRYLLGQQVQECCGIGPLLDKVDAWLKRDSTKMVTELATE